MLQVRILAGLNFKSRCVCFRGTEALTYRDHIFVLHVLFESPKEARSQTSHIWFEIGLQDGCSHAGKADAVAENGWRGGILPVRRNDIHQLGRELLGVGSNDVDDAAGVEED